MNQTPAGYTQKKCNQCQSPLVLLEKHTEKIGNYPDTVITTYRCSNAACQKDTDEKTLARIRFSGQQQAARENNRKTSVNLRLNKSRIYR